MNTLWRRVTKAHPCPICEKPDWCCVGDVFINCMRVQSDKESHNGGWLHKIDKDRPFRPLPPLRPVHPAERLAIDFKKLLWGWQNQTPDLELEVFAEVLGVDFLALKAIGVAWAKPHHAWAFAMRDQDGEVIGIRLRANDGRKWAVTGSKAGIFMAHPLLRQPMAFICEGPTDTAAVLSMGLWAYGRPSCTGGTELLQKTIRQHGVKEVVILSDNDEPGIHGARRLAEQLPIRCCVLVPPTKDVREMARLGGGGELLMGLCRQTVWHQPEKD